MNESLDQISEGIRDAQVSLKESCPIGFSCGFITWDGHKLFYRDKEALQSPIYDRIMFDRLLDLFVEQAQKCTKQMLEELLK